MYFFTWFVLHMSACSIVDEMSALHSFSWNTNTSIVLISQIVSSTFRSIPFAVVWKTLLFDSSSQL